MPDAFYQLGLIGYPLGHSRSPAIHTAALAAAGLAGEYRLYPVPPLPEGEAALHQVIERLRDGELDGLNVTIPHKQAVLPLLDEYSPAVAQIGAANTLYRQGDRLVGENTDAPGFLADLYRLSPELSGGPKTALVLGAGGSARAVVYALRRAGFTIWLAARRLSQAEQIASQSALARPSPPAIQAILLEAASIQAVVSRSQPPIALIVNTTPLGMAPAIDASPWPHGIDFPAGAVLYDLVYNPSQTRLVHQASQAGLRAFHGLGMLVEQAALAFEIWTGRRVPRAALFASLEASPGMETA